MFFEQTNSRPLAVAALSAAVLAIACGGPNDSGKPEAEGKDGRAASVKIPAEPLPQPVLQLGHTNEVTSVAWSPDGKTIASGSADGAVRLWDAPTGRIERTLVGHRGPVAQVAWSPDGKIVASVDRIPDRRNLAGVSGGKLRLWDATSGGVLLKTEFNVLGDVAWSPDGTRIAYTIESEFSDRWGVSDVATGEELATSPWHNEGASYVAWTADGKRIVSSRLGGKVTVSNASNGKPFYTFGGEAILFTGAVASPDRTRVAYGCENGTAKVRAVFGGKLLAMFKGPETRVSLVVWSPDGTRIASAGTGSVAHVWDASTGAALAAISGFGGWLGDLEWSPNGARILGRCLDGPNPFSVWDAATGKLLAALEGDQQEIRHAVWSPDGTKIAAGSARGVVLYRLSDGERIIVANTGTEDAPHALVYTDDGLFDGDAEARKLIMYRRGDDITSADNLLTADQVAGIFHRPGLFADFMAGKPIAKPGADAKTEEKRP